MKRNQKETIAFYDRNAREFVEQTSKASMSVMMEAFLKEIPKGCKILDFGCGSGRDTKAFMDLGYQVTAVDGSRKICEEASTFTGMAVRQMDFMELEEVDEYHGIWACASILHVPYSELKELFGKLYRALKQDGILYVSFKYGTFEGMRNERYFTDMTMERLRPVLDQVSKLEVLKYWVSADVRENRGDEQWLNLIMKKNQ